MPAYPIYFALRMLSASPRKARDARCERTIFKSENAANTNFKRDGPILVFIFVDTSVNRTGRL